MISIAVLGYGTIGSGVVEVIERNQKVIAGRAGDSIYVKYVLDLREFPDDPINEKVVHDFNIIKNDPEIEIVVEAMGGVEPAFTFAKGALEAGKHFATSNKALIAARGSELIALAKKKNVNCMFEASVGGGIPIIRTLCACLTGDVIEEVSGILNGTTNYMLTSMTEDGSEFDDVLKEAQRLGYAEADPSADIEGGDACRKIAILTSLISGKFADFEEIHTEGITNISAADIKYAKVLGKKIKLIASTYKEGDTYLPLVAPYMVGPGQQLYNVDGVFNAVFVKGNMLGDSLYFGSGAGKLPTASAVVGDVVDCARHLEEHVPMGWSSEKLILADYRKHAYRYFVRTSAGEDAVKEIFPDAEFITAEGIEGETAFTTQKINGFEFEEKAEKLGGIISRIRIK